MNLQNAVQLLELIRIILPHVSALCLADILSQAKTDDVSADDEEEAEATTGITTSPHVVSVESEHPYRPATVSHYRVHFPESVRWMCLEFDGQCCTTQAEDSLQLYLPSAAAAAATADSKDKADAGPVSLSDYWPVLSRFSGVDNWPTASLILPGNYYLIECFNYCNYFYG